jgi:hypothetical protein
MRLQVWIRNPSPELIALLWTHEAILRLNGYYHKRYNRS